MSAILEVLLTTLFGAPALRNKRSFKPVQFALAVVMLCFVAWMAVDI